MKINSPGRSAVDEVIEGRVLAALRAMHPKKLNDMLAVIEGMAQAFPIPAQPKPVLSLVAVNGRLLEKAKRKPSKGSQS